MPWTRRHEARYTTPLIPLNKGGMGVVFVSWCLRGKNYQRVSAKTCVLFGEYGLIRPTEGNGKDGLEEYLEIKPDRPVFNIIDIQFDHLFKGKQGAATDLPESGDAGPGL